MIVMWREIKTFEITEQRLVDQVGAIRRNEWLTEVELAVVRRKILTPTDDKENQKINEITIIEERIQNENGPMKPNTTEICVRVETEITNEECPIIDELKALMIRNETEEYLTLQKVD